MILGDGGPKNPRCRGAADGSSLQRQEGQQALGTGREQDGHAILLEPEPVQQGDTNVRPNLPRVPTGHWPPRSQVPVAQQLNTYHQTHASAAELLIALGAGLDGRWAR
jgi:hypothetical protein